MSKKTSLRVRLDEIHVTLLDSVLDEYRQKDPSLGRQDILQAIITTALEHTSFTKLQNDLPPLVVPTYNPK
jgi:hypothetical protein